MVERREKEGRRDEKGGGREGERRLRSLCRLR
jgi:hypothetical protein